MFIPMDGEAPENTAVSAAEMRYAIGFSVAPETMDLMRSMVKQGEADALVAERVWQELARGLMEPDPWRMLVVLAECGLLGRWLPELRIAIDSGRPVGEASTIVSRSLAYAAAQRFSLGVRFALLLRGARGEPGNDSRVEDVCARLKVPGDCRDLALLAESKAQAALRADRLDAQGLMALLDATDALRRPQRLEELMRVAEAESAASGSPQRPFPPARRALAALAAAQSVDGAALAREAMSEGSDIADHLRRARVERIAAALASKGDAG